MGEIVPLLSAPIEGFESGDQALDRWLKLRARSNEAAGFSRTHVMVHNEKPIGFYSLSAAAFDLRASELGAKSAPEPIPAILLGRMAVANTFQRLGVGKRLLADAIERAERFSRQVAATVLAVHPKPTAREYYLANGFAPIGNTEVVFLRL